MKFIQTHLSRLESEAIEILREVVSEAENPVMLYSVGKDSAVMLHLAKKAFYPSPPPFPLMHVDTTWKFQEMYKLRDKAAKDAKMELIVHQNPEANEKGINPFDHGALHTDMWKTEGLKQALDKHGFDAAFEQYTRNMVTGASTAELAVILIDARKGVLTQTRRHSYLCHLLGIKNIVLAVNKMDLVDYDQATFDAIVAEYTEFANSIGIMAFTAIPISGFKGDNIAAHSDATSWYNGLTLMAHLEGVDLDQNTGAAQEFRMPVQWVMGSSSLGMALVAGKNLVPKPATGKTALRSLVKETILNVMLWQRARYTQNS